MFHTYHIYQKNTYVYIIASVKFHAFHYELKITLTLIYPLSRDPSENVSSSDPGIMRETPSSEKIISSLDTPRTPPAFPGVLPLDGAGPALTLCLSPRLGCQHPLLV